jgi:pyruvate dehydrogenase E2 component (dihydrolipoamide acetyltransferase)
MAIEIVIPRLGWSMDEGVFVQWLKRDGEDVCEGDDLFELESEKSTQPIESFDTGVLRISPDGPHPGDVVKVGQRLGYLCKNGERAPFVNPPEENPPVQSQSQAQHIATGEKDGALAKIPQIESRDSSEVTSPSETSTCHTQEFVAEQLNAAARRPATAANSYNGSVREQIKVSPRAGRAAAKFGIPLSEITGRGASGRVRECDVLAVAVNRNASTTQTASTTIAAVAVHSPHEKTANTTAASAPSSIRQTIATRMLAAAQQTAAVTLTASADATELVKLRHQCRECTTEHAARCPSYTSILVKLVAAALERHQNMLGQWTDEGIVVPDGVHIAVAVDTPIGLMTPVVRDVPALSLGEVSDRLSDLISRARARRLLPQESHGGAFTITNLGAYRVDSFTPLLNLPQTSILGVGRIGSRPVAVNGSVEVREQVTFSLTFDHRAVDGAAAAALLTTICERGEKTLPTQLW